MEEVKEASKHYLDKWDESERAHRDLESIMPGNKMNIDVFRKAVEGEFSDKSSKFESLLPKRIAKSLMEENNDDALEAIARHFVAEEGEVKHTYIVDYQADTPTWIAIAYLQDNECEIRFHSSTVQRQPPTWLRELINKVREFLQGGPSSFTYRITGGQYIVDDDIDLGLFEIVRDNVRNRQGLEAPRESITMDEFRVCCFWRYVVEDFKIEWRRDPYAEPEESSSEHSDDMDEDDDDDDDDEDEDFEYQSMDEDDEAYEYQSSDNEVGKKLKGRRKRKAKDQDSGPKVKQHRLAIRSTSDEVEHVPPPEVRILLDDWEEDNAGDENQGVEDDRKQDEVEDILKHLDFQKVLDVMQSIQLDDGNIDSVISDLLKPHELQGLRITPERQASILSGLPDNQASSKHSMMHS